MRKLLIATMAVSVSAIAGTVLAQQSPPERPMVTQPGQACLQHNRLDRWNVVNSRTLEIHDKTETRFRVALNGTCAHSSFVDKIVFERPGASSLECIEVGDFIKLSMRGGPMEQCAVSEISLYTDVQHEIDAKVDPTTP